VVGGLAAGSAGGVVYEHGNYRGIVRAPMLDCQKAVIKAADDLNLVTLDSVFLGTRSKFVFRNFQKLKFKVSITCIDEKNTEVDIRAGWRGNRECSRQFLTAVENALR